MAKIFIPGYKFLERNRSLGIESECYGIQNSESLPQLYDFGWKREDDRSIIPTARSDFFLKNFHLPKPPDEKFREAEGYEFSSPVFTSANAEQISPALRIIEGTKAVTYLPCALHSHGGIIDNHEEEMWLPLIKQILINYIQIEDLILPFYLPEPIIIPFLKTYAPLNKQEIQNEILICKNVEELRDLIQPSRNGDELPSINLGQKGQSFKGVSGRRVSPVNLYSLGTTGTIEFRARVGTLSESATYRWMLFTDYMIAEAELAVEHSLEASIPGKGEIAHLESAIKCIINVGRNR